MCLDNLFGGEPAVDIPTQLPAAVPVATIAEKDTGSKIRIGTDDRVSKAKKKTTPETTTSKTGIQI